MQRSSPLNGVGVGKSQVALIFSGTGEMLSMLCPRKLVLDAPIGPETKMKQSL